MQFPKNTGIPKMLLFEKGFLKHMDCKLRIE